MLCRFCSNESEYIIEIPTTKNGEENGKKFFYVCGQCLRKWEEHGIDVCRCGNLYVREEGTYKEVHIKICERCDKGRVVVPSMQQGAVVA